MNKRCLVLIVLCLCVSLCACQPSQAASDPVWTGEPSAAELDFSAQYIRTNGYSDGAEFPRVVIIHSVEELQRYYEKNRETFDLERKNIVYADTTIGFLDACDKYDEAYFKERILVMVLLEEGSGSIRHEVTNVSIGADGVLSVAIERRCPDVCTDDMAEWHILIEPEAGVLIAEEKVLINGKSCPVSDGTGIGKA